MNDFITLVVPPGGEDTPISHGVHSFHAYRADASKANSEWHVKVPPYAAVHLTHNGGFMELKPLLRRRLSGNVIRMFHPDEPRSIGWDGDSFEPDEHGDVTIPVEAIADAVAFGFKPSPERPAAAVEVLQKTPQQRVEAKEGPALQEQVRTMEELREIGRNGKRREG